MTMFEPMAMKPIPRWQFIRRMARHVGYSGMLVLISLVGGIVGFELSAHMSLVDAFLNASMLLGGMGPVGIPDTNAAKVFASFYALYAGLVFLLIASILFAPVFHRVLHRFHWESQEDH
jgi:hypothetical protein